MNKDGSVNLYFSVPLSNPSHFRVFEVTDEILKEIEKNDGSVCVKGTDVCEAVLCTSHETYTIRQADTSNTLLLVDDSLALGDKRKVEVKGPLHSQIELQKTLPRVDQLQYLLLQNPIYLDKDTDNGDNANQNSPSHPGATSATTSASSNSETLPPMIRKDITCRSKKTSYTTEELLDLVQASPVELQQALDNFNAFQYEGKWRVLSEEAMATIVDDIVFVCQAHGWSLDSVPVDELLRGISSDFPREFVHQCIKNITKKSTEQQSTEQKIISLNREFIAILKAHRILQQKPIHRVDDFLKLWRDSLPEEMSVIIKDKNCLNLLKGLAIVDEQIERGDPKIRYFPSRDLSTNARERFKELFAFKPKWTYGQLAPYLKDLLTPEETEERLLLNWTRQCTVNGVKWYSSRE
jgi:sister chromatid cohesion protein DCC1